MENHVAVSEAGKKLKGKTPSLQKMLEEDSELKDFFRLVHENGFREKAVALLHEKLNKN